MDHTNNNDQHKLREYEITLLFYNQYHDAIIEETIHKFFSDIDKNLYKLHNITSIVRYDVIFKDKQVKSNVVTVFVDLDTSIIKKVNINIKKQSKVIMKYLFIKKNYLIKPDIYDYKKPINIKKHIFESQRIMCRELNCLNKKDQRLLAKNIKRCRILGLFGTAKRIIK